MEKNNNNQFFRNSVIWAAFVLILVQPYFTWFYADDYCLIPKLKAKGMWESMLLDYNTWDGRSLSVVYFLSRIGHFFEVYWIGPLLSTFMVFLSAFFLIKEIDVFNRVQKFQYTTMVSVVIWLGSFYFISQTVYWSTGIGYSFEMLFIVIFYRMIDKGKDKVNGLSLLFFLIVGSFSTNAVFAILFVLFIHYLYNIYINKVKLNKLLLFTAVIFIGLIVVIIAPGNANRLPDNHVVENNLFNPYKLYANINWMFSSMLVYNTPITWLFLLLGVFGATISMKRHMEKVSFFKKAVIWLWFNKWLIAAFISVFAFLPIPGFYTHSSRLNVHFFTFIMVYGISNFNAVIPLVPLLVRKAISSSILIIFFVTIVFQTYDAYIVKGMMAKRVQYLKSKKGQDVYFKRDDLVNPPKTRDFLDISADSTYWLNKCACEYFELKSIKREP